MFKLTSVKFIYNCYNSIAYVNFRDRLVQNSQIHHYNTRTKTKVRTPFARLQICQNSFLIKGINIWNELPDAVKQAKTMLYLKSKVKKLLLVPNYLP